MNEYFVFSSENKRDIRSRNSSWCLYGCLCNYYELTCYELYNYYLWLNLTNVMTSATQFDMLLNFMELWVHWLVIQINNGATLTIEDLYVVQWIESLLKPKNRYNYFHMAFQYNKNGILCRSQYSGVIIDGGFLSSLPI